MFDSGLVASVPGQSQPANSAPNTTENVLFQIDGEFGQAVIKPVAGVTNERAQAFLEYASEKTSAEAYSYAVVASAVAVSGGDGENSSSKSKGPIFAELPIGG
jgi:hypothetical protein